MKICSKCSSEKSISEFAWRSKDKNLLHGQCNDCRRDTAKQSYLRHRDSIVAAVRARNDTNKNIFTKWKSKLSCVCCNEDYIKCLDFHHIDANDKDSDISGMMSRYSFDSVMKEISKCIVVCSNCHRKIHGGILEITPEILEKSNKMIKNTSLYFNE